MRHTELAELILDESGYTGMWQAERSPQAQSKLENLKELIRFMEEFDTLAGFLEHVSLVMDATDRGRRRPRQPDDAAQRQGARVRHRVPARLGRRASSPISAALTSAGAPGSRRSAGSPMSGLTRARKHAKITFAQNRRNHGTWQQALPSRFIDELPVDHVEVAEDKGLRGYGPSRFDTAENLFAAGFYETPGWQRAQRNRPRGSEQRSPRAREPITIDGTLVAASTAEGAGIEVGVRVFHQKFGYGYVAHVDGNKLTVDFDKAGQKKVVDTFVERA